MAISHPLKILGTSLLALSASSQASLLNSDFSNNLQGWSTQYDYVDTNGIVQTGNDPHSQIYQTSIQQVSLNTLFTDPGNEVFNVSLSQVFSLEPIMAGEQWWFNADVNTVLSNDQQDFVIAGLFNLTNGEDIQLAELNRIDLTAWAGHDIELFFNLTDGDFMPEDSVTISNLSIERVAVVSEPGLLALFAATGLMLVRRRK